MMLILRVGVAAGLCLLGVAGAPAQTTVDDTLALTRVSIVDVESGAIRRNQTIVVSARSGRIVEIVAPCAAVRSSPQ